MKSTMYTMIIRDNIPEITPISSYGTLRMPDGKLYWIVPVEQTISEPKPSELRLSEPEASEILAKLRSELSARDLVIKMLKDNKHSILGISRRTGLSPWECQEIIKEAGLRTPAEEYRLIIEKALLNAGEAGKTPHALVSLAPKGQRLGPVVRSMIHKGIIKRLPNGNYVHNL